MFSFMSSRLLLSIWYRSFSSKSDSIFSYAYSSELTLFFPSGGFHPQIFNNSIVLFMPVNFIYVFGIMPAVLSRPNFIILRTKVSQDLAFVWWMTRAMYETYGFRSILRMIYISLPALSVFGKSAYPLIFLLWPAWLASALVVFL